MLKYFPHAPWQVALFSDSYKHREVFICICILYFIMIFIFNYFILVWKSGQIIKNM